ncbi:radical SAM protein [Geomonas azotofigens]|uniref:radical SAM protein n=1 Tax=Geomonas azotofigens TaxID=2843196 RepID=UPI001C0F9C9B|nr:radical SAM protein [Geomonas azotofigens]MBU5614712.1 radical SAM protein [Geomonas azotofigens]
MSTMDVRNSQIAGNRLEYGRHYDFLQFVTLAQATAASDERDELLAWLRTHADFGCGDTKVDCGRLSPGCRTCATGGWSCLFINGRCNASCFYCPTSQDDTGDPLTNGIPFASPEDYAEYVARFGFTGASISGGEPLLTLDRTLAYLDAVRRRCGDSVHLWLYTNGTLLTKEIATELRSAGLGEIRFDIGATGYHLAKLQLAVGVIPTVTVEIPAVPEEEGVLRGKLTEMAAVGVQHLNLHQMRLTPHNSRHLASRPYTFVHGESVTVLESELTALRLVRFALEKGIGLPVNYCSFPYKRRFQHAAARRRGIPFVRGSGEEVTQAGYMRAVGGGNVQYFEAVTLPRGIYQHPVVEIALPSGGRIAVEKRPVSQLMPAAASTFASLSEETVFPAELQRFERIAMGLADYF